VAADLKRKSFRAFGIIRICGFCQLLHEIAIAIAMRHFMLAHCPRDLILIETEEQKIQRDGIKLYPDGKNCKQCKYAPRFFAHL
jgi:hypothetical protein